MLTCKDIVDKISKIDSEAFPFLSLNETEMIIIFTKRKEKKIKRFLDSNKFDYKIKGNQIRIKIKKMRKR